MARWLITIVIVLALAGLALSAPWWLPGLLEPYLGDPAVIESATALAQLILWVLAGLSAVLGIRWALSRKKPGYQVMTADDLEAARAASRAEAEPDEPEQGPADGQVPVERPAQAPGEGLPLAESLFGPQGAIPAGTLDTGQPSGEAPEASLSEALFGEGGPLVSGSLEPTSPRPAAGFDPYGAQDWPEEDWGPGWDESAGAGEARPVSAPGAGRFNLPADLPDFFGRQAELAQVYHDLVAGPGQAARQSPAISTLSGMGGVGKTALALHLAHALASEGRFPDAHLFIDLKGSSPNPLLPAAALEALLATLLGPDPERPHDGDTLAHLWRAALQDRRVLLVLDDATGASQIRPLLPGNPACAVLVTSQQRFALPGAGRLDLEPLASEEAQAFLQCLVPRLEDEEALQIAGQCGGLPLALRIAGNHLALNDDLSPVVYITHLAREDARLDLLHDPGEPDLDVAATLSSSIDRLSEPLRLSWTALAHLPVPFDVPAAAAVWGRGATRENWRPLDAGEALDRLRVLRNSSLLTYNPETGRYGQHVLLRLAAGRELARLDEEARAEMRHRMAWHFREVALSADEDQRYEELDPDWPHLRAALDYTSRNDPVLFSELVQVLNNYWSTRGMAREQAMWNDLAAKNSAQIGKPGSEGLHLGALAAAYDELGEPRQAIEAYGRAIRASRTSGDQIGEANHLLGVGWAYQLMDDFDMALNYYQQSLDLSREVGDAEGETAALGYLGQAYARLEDYRRAIGYYQQAVARARQTGDRQAEGIWLGGLAACYAELGDAHQAVKTREMALSIAREDGSRREEAAHLVGLGYAYALLDETAAPAEAVASTDGPRAEGRAWGDEVELKPIRQITVPAPRGVEVWIDSPFPPELDLGDLADQPDAVLEEGLEAPGGDVDLVVQDIWAATTPLTPGDWETLVFRIQNLGTDSASGRFYVRMWFDNVVVRTWYADGLGAGRTAVGRLQVNCAEPGSHQVRVHILTGYRVPQRDLGNDVRTETWVWGDAPEGGPGAPVGDDLEAWLAGPEPFPSEWGEETELPSIRQIRIPATRGVSVRTVQDPAPYPSAWATGRSLDQSQADLVVQDIWSTSTPPMPGQWCPVAFRILNQGALSVSSRFYVRMWLDGAVVGTWYLDGLATGRSAVGWTRLRVAEAGSHTIRVIADYGDAVPEPDKENNIRTEAWNWGEQGAAPAGEAAQLAGPWPLPYDWGEEGALAPIKQIVIPSPSGIEVKPAYVLEGQVWDEAPYKSRIGVDLTVLDAWSPTMPLEAQVWETIALRIRNEGTDHASTRFYTRMWFDRTLIRTWYVDGLQAGATAIGWVQVRVAEPGSHEIRVQVDVTHAVAEADEENNTLIETWEWVQPQPESTTQTPTAALPAQAVDGSLGLPDPVQPVTPGREQARALWTEALQIYEELGDPQSEDVRARLAALDA